MILQYKGYQIKDAVKREYMDRQSTSSGIIHVIRQEGEKETLMKKYSWGKHGTDRSREEIIEVAKQFVKDQLLIGLKATVLKPDGYLRMIGLTEGMEGTIYEVRRNMNGRRVLRLGILFGDKEYFLRRDEVLIEQLPEEDNLDIKASVWKPCTYEELMKVRNQDILIAYNWDGNRSVAAVHNIVDGWYFWYTERKVPDELLKSVHHYLEAELPFDFFKPDNLTTHE